MIFFVENIRAYDKVWFLGESFLATSFDNYYQKPINKRSSNGKHLFYTRAHYDVTGFTKGTMLPSNNYPNILVRLKNALISGLNEQVLLPIVLDDDLMDALNHYKEGFSLSIGKLMEWLANEFHDLIAKHKEKLPSKSRKFKYPCILWCKIPLHEIYGEYNEFKGKFNRSLEKMVPLFREMETLEVKWDDKDLSYFSAGRISPHGLRTYWAAIDKAFENWDKEQMKSTLAVSHKPKGVTYEPPHNYHKPDQKWKSNPVSRYRKDRSIITGNEFKQPLSRGFVDFWKPLVPYK